MHSQNFSLFQEGQELFRPLIDTVVFLCKEEATAPDLDRFTEPVRTLVIRTPANTVPLYGEQCDSARILAQYTGAESSLRRIIVRGHTHCNHLSRLLDRSRFKPDWLERCRRTLDQMNGTDPDLPADQKLAVGIYHNVVEQRRNLLSYPAVVESFSRNNLKLFGWVFDAEYDWVSVYDPEADVFVPPNVIPDLAPMPAQPEASEH